MCLFRLLSSSPHVGGDFLNLMASSKSKAQSESRGGSGRNTPTQHTPHRSIPAQLAHPYGQPRRMEGTNGSDNEEEEDNRGSGWRPISPARLDSPSAKRGPSSRSLQQEQQQQQQERDLQMNQVLASPDGQTDISSSVDSSPIDLSSSGSGEVRYSNLPPVLKGYLLGQIACVVKFGVWWVGFTAVIFALFGGSSYLVGGTRICFNLALLLCSPMAGGIAEKTNIKKLLNKTVIGRGLIYCMFIPVAWLLMDTDLVYRTGDGLHTAFFVVFLLIIFADGIGVSFSNVADIDSGGVNLVAAQYGIEIDDNIRNYFNSLHIMFFDLSMVIFNPILAYVGLFIGQHTVSDAQGEVGNVVDELTLLMAIGGVFFVSTVVTLLCYNIYMPDLKPSAFDQSIDQSLAHLHALDGDDPANMSMNGGGGGGGNLSIAIAEPDPLSWAQFKELATSVKEGAILTWANTRIRYRVLFFAVETSVEDAMIALIAAEIGSQVYAPQDSNLHYAYGNLWGAGLVACGKTGGVLASILMHRYFTTDPNAPDPSAVFKPLFWFAFLGGVCSLLLPLAYRLRSHELVSDSVSTALLFVGMFLFFLFSTLSKIGFSTLMQSMAAEIEATGRVFGFVAAFVTATDAIILMGMSAIFSACGLELALWIACAFIATHGLVELVFGPALVLRKPEQTLDEQLSNDLHQPLNL